MFNNMTEEKYRRLLVIMSALLCVSLLLNILSFTGMPGSFAGAGAEGGEETEETAEISQGELSREGYTLEEVVIVSRHNIRAPLSGNGSDLDSLTPYTWFDWSSKPSDLSLRGGTLETTMGQYFRKWLEKEEFIPENWHPEEGEVRFYANSKQRTIATAEFFRTGLLPTADVPVETHAEFDTMDPVFHPRLTFVSDSYTKAVTDQVWELYGDKMRSLTENYRLISEVIDVENSEAAKSGKFTGFDPEDMQLVFVLNEEPAMKGSLKTGTSVSDALVLQYYEEKDAAKAAFGHNLTEKQWQMISDIKDTYGEVLFGTPLMSRNVANPLLKEIRSELNTEGRKFTFLCGHDSNIMSVLTALQVKPYTLSGSAERQTPIGSKIVICRWRSPEGSEWISADLVYQTTDQLRSLTLLDLENHPAVCPLSFEGIKQNSDGLFQAQDFRQRLEEAISAYDVIKEQYKES